VALLRHQLEVAEIKGGHRAPKTVNNHLTLLTTMLNLAVELGWLARAPKIKKVKAPACGPDYRYLRAQAELAQFLSAARAEDEPVRVIPGVRRSHLPEVASAEPRHRVRR
jgi:hypothetical protein